MHRRPGQATRVGSARTRGASGSGVRLRRAAVAVALAWLAGSAPGVAVGAAGQKLPATSERAKAHARHRHHVKAKPRPTTPAAAPAPAKIAACLDADLIPAATNTARVGVATLCLINQVRAHRRIGALLGNAKLAQAARRHTSDMVASEYLDHDGPAGDTPKSRVQDAGYLTATSTGYGLGELVDYALSEQATARGIVAKWSSAPDFMTTLLDPAYRDAGIGVAASAPAAWSNGESGATYTVDFGRLTPGQ